MKKIILLSSFFLGLLIALFILSFFIKPAKKTQWSFQSIDTMKYSRDLSREKLNDPAFIETIDKQVADIASTGATHVAIATPYDKEFVPILKKWVAAARKSHLKVWFRGNFSGWEEWFSYSKITPEEHIKMTNDFIINNSILFEDGDIFTSCPECENGGDGDPRVTQKVEEYRKFLTDEYNVTKSAFKKINKKVASNFYSMNYDVAKLVMNEDTTKSLDGVVTIDHYVKDPEKLNSDINLLAQSSGGKVVLGEFGAPIPDIHGTFTGSQQADWINRALTLVNTNTNIIGLNYWVNVGGSTQLWNDKGQANEAVDVIKSFYSPK